MNEWLRWLLDTTPFYPRASCGTGWSPELIFAHVIPDEVIFTCYLYLPVILAAWWKYRWALSRTTIGLWGGFVMTCGLTHQSDVLMFTHPWYRLHAVVKLVCALFSVAACGQTTLSAALVIVATRRGRSSGAA